MATLVVSPLSPGKMEVEEEEGCEAVGEKGRKEKVVPPVAAAPADVDTPPVAAAGAGAGVGVMDEREGGSMIGRVVGGEELGPRVAPMEEEEVLRRAMPSSEEEEEVEPVVEVEAEVEMDAEFEAASVRGAAPLVEASK